jgi:hypothetical protein
MSETIEAVAFRLDPEAWETRGARRTPYTDAMKNRRAKARQSARAAINALMERGWSNG